MSVLKLARKFITREDNRDQELQQFKVYYQNNTQFVRNSIFGMVNSDAVDDLVQETFVKAWSGFHRFNEDSSFRTWIYRIAMNVTYDYLKTLKNDVVFEDCPGVSEDRELSDLISKGLMTLEIEIREPFSLHYQQGFTYEEVAALMNIATGTVKSRVHKAKAQFVSFLKENGVNNG